jgi:hypothetical protein
LPNIIGINHVCISSKNILVDSKKFEKLGYKMSFSENQLKIVKEKRQFILSNNEFHDLIFLKSQSHISIELINHHDFTGHKNENYNVILDISKLNHTDFEDVKKDPICQLLENEFKFKFFKKMDKKISFSFYGQKNSKFNENIIIISNSDIDKSSKFWCTLFGFNEIKSGINNYINYKILEFNAPIKKWSIKIIIISKKILNQKKYLNDFGCTCISFIVTSIEDFLKNNEKFEFFSNSKPYDVIIGGKKMKLVFLRGLDNEIIELMEFRKND